MKGLFKTIIKQKGLFETIIKYFFYSVALINWASHNCPCKFVCVLNGIYIRIHKRLTLFLHIFVSAHFPEHPLVMNVYGDSYIEDRWKVELHNMGLFHPMETFID